jgi:DNA primase
MYKTHSTNSINSAAISHQMSSFQLDIFREEELRHNPDQLITSQVFHHYHQKLNEHPTLIHALSSRKVKEEYIEQFNIGFCDRTMGFELQSPKCLLGSKNRGRLQRLGLLKDSGHEFFRGALVIPYQDNQGNIVGAYGRRWRHQRRSPAYHLFWNADQSPLFNAQTLIQSENIILCKSPIDALTMMSAGVSNVVATMGVKGFNQSQLEQMVDAGTKCVSIAFDQAPEAQRYARLISQALAVVNISCKKITLPIGLDINGYAMLHDNVTAAFRAIIETAKPTSQRYAYLEKPHKESFSIRIETLDECIDFYLKERKSAGNSKRGLETSRYHLHQFRDYCLSLSIFKVSDLTSALLESYQFHVQKVVNPFTGFTISLCTQKERLDAVSRMLARLHYFGIIAEPVFFVQRDGVLH